jgi:hypothetical protein
MKYKHVFFIWLLANLILAFGLFIIIATSLKEDLNILFAIIIYGFGISLPLLILLMGFNAVIIHKNRLQNLKLKYLLAIISINILYFLVSLYFFQSDWEFNFFYIFSFLSGWLSLELVAKKAGI